jgi:hypothetical protein
LCFSRSMFNQRMGEALCAIKQAAPPGLSTLLRQVPLSFRVRKPSPGLCRKEKESASNYPHA